jgi:hypothetical protein
VQSAESPGPAELLGEPTVPGAELAQEPPIPAVAALPAALHEPGEVEQEDRQRGGQEGREPVRHQARLSRISPRGGTLGGRVRDQGAGECLQTTAFRFESAGMTVSVGVAPSLSATRWERTLSGEIRETSRSIDRDS